MVLLASWCFAKFLVKVVEPWFDFVMFVQFLLISWYSKLLKTNLKLVWITIISSLDLFHLLSLNKSFTLLFLIFNLISSLFRSNINVNFLSIHIKPRMGLYVNNSNSIFRISCQHSSHQINSFWWNHFLVRLIFILWQFPFVLYNILCQYLSISLKRVLIKQYHVKDNPHGPNISSWISIDLISWE